MTGLISGRLWGLIATKTMGPMESPFRVLERAHKAQSYRATVCGAQYNNPSKKPKNNTSSDLRGEKYKQLDHVCYLTKEAEDTVPTAEANDIIHLEIDHRRKEDWTATIGNTIFAKIQDT